MSGDHIKSASDLGVPLVAVGLFYSQGYFHQRLDDNNYQYEEYIDTQVGNLPIKPAVSRSGEPITVSIDTRTGPLLAKVWMMQVGRVKLFLLDCNVEGNSPDDRQLTSRLYGGGERTRIRQELVLGVGGVKALAAIGIDPGVYHLNEGHCAFAPLEVIHLRMEENGVTFEEALREVAIQTVFTTHTPVPAGHDQFVGELVEEHLGPLADKVGLTFDQVMELGRTNPQNKNEPLCMTAVGLKLSRTANAVSQLHGNVSRRMWSQLWPWKEEEEIPIGHITNGVHTLSWLADQMHTLYDRNFEAGWRQRIGKSNAWRSIHDVDPGELWETHNTLRTLMISFVRRRNAVQTQRRNAAPDVVAAAKQVLDPTILTVGFGRRFATYKRANLIASDLDRLDAMINSSKPTSAIYFRGQSPSERRTGQGIYSRNRGTEKRSAICGPCRLYRGLRR